MKQAQKVMTRFPIETDLEADHIKQLLDLINEVCDDAGSDVWKRKETSIDDAISG